MNSEPRVYVDFSVVESKHKAVDARLENWARWSQDSGRGGLSSPMFRLYRAPKHWRQYAVDSDPVDSIDAARIQAMVVMLPTSHRLAVCWCYISRWNPVRAASDLGVSLQGLLALVRDGRQMLANRGA